MAIVQRQITTYINKLLSKYPVIAVTGPRQSGKTTLLKNLFPTYDYVSLEDNDNRSFAMDDPVGFLARYQEKTIFDEVQRVPQLFSYLQTIVDNQQVMGQFILSGSQNFQLLEQITQSLAGRVALFKLLPFDVQELQQANLLPDTWKFLAVKGAYPAIYDRDIESPVFYSNYIQTYINRDVSELTGIQNLGRFNNFIQLCASRVGQLINMSDLARDCGISQPTVKSWLSILESSYIIFLLRPYFENFSKRIVKSPKLYFYDTGLAAFLLGFRTPQELDNHSIKGSLFENLVISNIHKTNHHQYALREYWFWRDHNNNEVDLITKRGGYFDIFEMKSTETITSKLVKGLGYFEEIAKNKVNQKILYYGGRDTHERSDYSVRGWDFY